VSRKWIASYVAFGCLLLFYVAWLTFTGTEHARTKALEILAWVILPGGVFFLAAIPLQRGCRNQAGLFVLAIVAGGSAFALMAFTWGFALPIAVGLLSISGACLSSALSSSV
jgi:hypothetical protein